MNGMFSGIKAAFYDFKAGYYGTKGEFNRHIYDMLARQGNRITVDGSNRRTMSRDQLQQVRNANSRAAVQAI